MAHERYLKNLNEQNSMEKVDGFIKEQHKIRKDAEKKMAERAKILKDEGIAKKFVEHLLGQAEQDNELQSQSDVQTFIDSIHMTQIGDFLKNVNDSKEYDNILIQLDCEDEIKEPKGDAEVKNFQHLDENRSKTEIE